MNNLVIGMCFPASRGAYASQSKLWEEENYFVRGERDLQWLNEDVAQLKEQVATEQTHP